MAKVDIDPTGFTSWEDAFQYPIPQTRQFEKQLRNHAEANKQKLRTIVGASYRDLLGTADRTLDMDLEMRSVDRSLSLVGQKTNVKAVDRIFDSCKQLGAQSKNRQWEQLSFISQMTVLQRCSLLLAQQVRRKESPLSSAKVLVLSRLLHKVLSTSQPESALLKSLQQRLSSTRRRLLRTIEASLTLPDIEQTVLLDNMCAFALTTSASPSDVLRHFHATRLQAIQSLLTQGHETNVASDPAAAIKILINTVRQTSQIFSKKLSDALARLKEIPLLKQKEIVNLDLLELNIHGSWIAPEILSYTPWTRHEELSKPQTDKLLKLWTQQAVSTLKQHIQQHVASQTNFEDVAATRQAIFTAWPWNSRALPGLDAEQVVDDLRQILNDRLVDIMRTSTKQIGAVLQDLPSVVAQNHTSSKSIWESDLISADVSRGAVRFKGDVRRALGGVDFAVESWLQRYDAWLEQSTAHMAALKALKGQRWDSDLADEDEEMDGDARRALLSEDDPRELEDALSQQLQEAFNDISSSVKQAAENTTNSDAVTLNAAQLSLLRVVRELSQRSIGDDYSRKLQFSSHFPANVIAPIQQRIAQETANSAVQKLKERLDVRRSSSAHLVTRPLWEGNSPLPVQPSTTSLRFLNELSKSMSGCGPDLWSSGMVKLFKSHVSKEINPLFEHAFDVVKKSSITNGTSRSESAEEKEHTDENSSQKLQTIVLLFDYLYLLQALSANDGGSKSAAQEVLSFATSAVDAAAVERLQKSAAEYWKRTYLIHALLVD